MVKSLRDVKWKEFRIDSLFIQDRGKEAAPNQIKSIGTIPVINEIQSNNGLSTFGKGKKLMKGNAITVSVNFAQNVFYQNKPFYASVNILVLYSKNLNKYIGEFIASCIRIANTKYNYAYKTSKERLNATKILLPINVKGEPDYEFMEEYIKEREAKLKEQYKNHVKARVAELTKEINPAQKWDDFFISDIFTSIQRGKRLTKEKQTIGKIPYVSSTSLNNGVDNFIGNDTGVRIFQDCLSLANSGSVGSCFYEPFKFVASDHVTHLKNNYSKYTYLFLACLLNRLSEKYNFNREINDDRISREKILLPVTPKGEPDYTYMENYMKYLEQKKLLEYLNYIK